MSQRTTRSNRQPLKETTGRNAERSAPKRKAVNEPTGNEAKATKVKATKNAKETTVKEKTVTKTVKETKKAETTTAEPPQKRGRKRALNHAADPDQPGTSKETKNNVDNKKAKVEKKVTQEIEPLLPVPKIPEESGDLLTFGTGDIGQLGLGEDVYEKLYPGKVQMEQPIVDIMAGGMHTVCLTRTGDVYTFGCNDEGALGRDTDDNEAAQFLPMKVTLPERVVQVTAGDSHTAALTETGKVYIWGNFRDNSGKMGLLADKKDGTNFPVLLPNMNSIAQIASGGNHLICLGTDGTIYTLGNSEQGQLGRISPYNLDRGGRRGLESVLSPGSVAFRSRRKKFDRVWAGTYSSFVRAHGTGEIYGFGLNACYQLGLSVNDDIICVPQKLRSFMNRQWIRITSGGQHTIALDTTGAVFALGRSDYGRLGLGQRENNADVDELTEVTTLRDHPCLDVSCGTAVSYAVTNKGELYTWGSTTNSQLGRDDEDDVLEPQIVPCKSVRTRKCLRISGGGQHAVLLAQPVEENDAT